MLARVAALAFQTFELPVLSAGSVLDPSGPCGDFDARTLHALHADHRRSVDPLHYFAGRYISSCYHHASRTDGSGGEDTDVDADPWKLPSSRK